MEVWDKNFCRLLFLKDIYIVIGGDEAPLRLESLDRNTIVLGIGGVHAT